MPMMDRSPSAAWVESYVPGLAPAVASSVAASKVS